MLCLPVYIKVLENKSLRTIKGHEKEKLKNYNKWVQSVFFTIIRHHLLIRTSVACAGKKSLALTLRVRKCIYFPEPAVENNSFLLVI